MFQTLQSEARISRRAASVNLQRGRTHLKAKAKEMKKMGIQIVDMSGYVIERPYGEFESPPKYVLDEVRRATESGWPEPSPRGIPSLRETIADVEGKIVQMEVDPDAEVLVTGGGSMQGLYNTIQATIDPGDEVVVFRPGLPYDEIVKLAEGVPVFIDLAQENDYRFDSQKVERAITERTKMIIFNTPHNPSGHVASQDEIEGVADCAKRHDLLVVSDEVLWNWVYDNRKHVSIASRPGMRDRTVIVNSLTKSGMFDWRIGWVIARPSIIDRLEKIMFWQNQFSPPLLQVAAEAHLSRLSEWIAPLISKQQTKRDFLQTELVRMNFSCFKPEGAIMTFPRITNFADDDCILFGERLLDEAHVLVSPGTAYLGDGHLRIGYGNSLDQIREGTRRIAGVVEKTESKR